MKYFYLSLKGIDKSRKLNRDKLMDLRSFLNPFFYIKFYEQREEKEILIMKKVVNEVVKQGQENSVLDFNFEGHDVRAIAIDGEPWFVGKDVATALGYKNQRDAIKKQVEVEDKRPNVAIYDGRQNRKMTIINESGMYSLILSSTLDSAKKFKKWVTSEVLPSIRKMVDIFMDKKI